MGSQSISAYPESRVLMILNSLLLTMDQPIKGVAYLDSIKDPQGDTSGI